MFGKVVKSQNFCNRSQEIKALQDNFNNLVNTTLISPRRWGKSSLVKVAATRTTRKNKKIRICHLDVFKIRSEQEFYHQLTLELLKSTAGKMSEISSTVGTFLKQFIPKITFSPMDDTEFTLGMDWNAVAKNPDEILDLAETIAKQKKIKIIVCIDEFQNISYFKNSVAFQKKLRANWQKHEHVAYCLYGSKRHMLLEFFTSRSMPFYQFGTIMLLEKIETTEWLKFIKKHFDRTNKRIDDSEARRIASAMENHPYYVQQLAHIVWTRTKKVCSVEIVDRSISQLIDQLSLLFYNLTDRLSTKQLNLLGAILNNEEEISSSATIKKYDLGTSGTVVRSKNALIEKEIIDDFNGGISFIDPVYKIWLERDYFN